MPRAIFDRASSAAAPVMDPNTRQTTAAARRIRLVGSDIYFAPAYCISVLRIGGSALEWRRSSRTLVVLMMSGSCVPIQWSSSRRDVMHRHVSRGTLCAVLLLLVSAVAGAQQFTGGVRGEVRDQNGVIPGVTVTLVNEATNISREGVTNAVGQYNFPAMAPGTYTLKTQLTGYKSYESKGLIVGTQQ